MTRSENLEWKRVLLDIANVELPQGTGLYQQGETGLQLYSLRSGLVKLVQHLPNGTERIVNAVRRNRNAVRRNRRAQ